MGRLVQRTKKRVTLPGLVLNVPLLARRTLDEVARVLGRSEATAGNRHDRYRTFTYQNGDVQVVFVDGQANWIKLNNVKGLLFSKDALTRLGLPLKRPRSVGNATMSWDNIYGVREVTMHSNGAGGVSSVLICVETTKNPPSKPQPSWTLNRLSSAFG